jgi:hypothetical protein
MNTIRYNSKTLVDDNNIMWSMDYDSMDNTVTVVSDYAVAGSCAIVAQYSMDNATGQDIPDVVLTSATDMLEQDSDRVNADDAERINEIIEQFASPKQS